MAFNASAKLFPHRSAYATDTLCLPVCQSVSNRGTIFKVNHRANGIRIACGQLNLLPQKDKIIFKYALPTQIKKNPPDQSVLHCVFV